METLATLSKYTDNKEHETQFSVGIIKNYTNPKETNWLGNVKSFNKSL